MTVNGNYTDSFKQLTGAVTAATTKLHNLGMQQASGKKYVNTAQMPQDVKDKITFLGNKIAAIEKQEPVYKDSSEKFAKAMDVMQDLLQYANNALGTMNSTFDLKDADQRYILQNSFTELLFSLENTLNASYSGGYVFGSKPDNKNPPVQNITINPNYGPDKKPNYNYVNYNLSDTADMALNPATEGFRDMIASSHMILDFLTNYNQEENLPAKAVKLFTTGQDGIRLVLGKVSGSLAQTNAKLESNSQDAINLNERLSELLSQSPIEIATEMAEMKSHIESLLGVLTTLTTRKRLWDIR